jgi:hypothetical protein
MGKFFVTVAPKIIGITNAIAYNFDEGIKTPDLLHLSFILCHAGANANGDYFFESELEVAARTPVNKPMNWEHDPLLNIGTITDSWYTPSSTMIGSKGHISCTGVVWAMVYQEYAQKIREKAMNGELAVSMECYFSDYVWIVGDESYQIPSDHQLADQLQMTWANKGAYDGKPVFRGFKNLFFSASGIVENPADKAAVFLSVAALQDDRKVIKIGYKPISRGQFEGETVSDNGIIDTNTKGGECVGKNDINEDIVSLIAEMVEDAVEGYSTGEKWTRKYINDLPDAAFAVIEPAFKRGEVDNKNTRHLPHHNKGVKSAAENTSVDIVHLKNALARASQTKPVTDSISKESMAKKAEAHLRKHAKALLKSYKKEGEASEEDYDEFTNDELIDALSSTEETQSKEGESIAMTEKTPESASEQEVVATEIPAEEIVADNPQEVEATAEINPVVTPEVVETPAPEEDAVKAKVEGLEAKIAELTGLVEKMVQKNSDAALAEMINARMCVIEDAGIKFSEAKQEDVKQKVASMSDEDFSSFLDILKDMASVKTPETSSEAALEEPVVAVEEPPTEQAVAVETEVFDTRAIARALFVMNNKGVAEDGSSDADNESDGPSTKEAIRSIFDLRK